ncbi:restriction endonuclease subunit S [uncultured Winogradskyella sp.]|uniref:restriction endonuclease subunit S n=1 Tax=uncultured Winogradskyella sp. TaxID=395353 RepID=UPI0030D939EC|tara:strand:- start:3548 stop:4837 length:1290 start_codon:yes stop_codon:yes gene_type:complete
MNNEKQIVPDLRFPEFAGHWDFPLIQKLIDEQIIVSHLDGNHGSLYPRREEFTEKGIPYVTANDFINGYVDFSNSKRLPLERAKKFKKGVAIDGDILFAHNATVGPVAKLETDLDFVILSTTATYFRCDNNTLINDFLKHSLSSPYFVKQYTRVMAQSTRNQVPITTQRKFNLLIPNPKEQQKIANCLSSLDEVISSETEKLDLLKDHKKGLLQQLFPVNGETQPHYRFPEYRNDGDWVSHNLGKICTYFNGGSNEKNVIDDGDYYLISLNSIDIEGNLKKEMKRVSISDDSLIKNDLVMVLSDVAHGNFLGLCAIIPNEKYVLNQRMAGLRLKNKDVNIQFLRFFINNNQKYFKQTGQGSSQQNLAKSSVEKFPVLLPKDLKEQQKIANCLSSVDGFIESQIQKIKGLKNHKKGLMQQLFPKVNSLTI